MPGRCPLLANILTARKISSGNIGGGSAWRGGRGLGGAAAVAARAFFYRTGVSESRRAGGDEAVAFQPLVLWGCFGRTSEASEARPAKQASPDRRDGQFISAARRWLVASSHLVVTERKSRKEGKKSQWQCSFSHEHVLLIAHTFQFLQQREWEGMLPRPVNSCYCHGRALMRGNSDPLDGCYRRPAAGTPSTHDAGRGHTTSVISLKS